MVCAWQCTHPRTHASVCQLHFVLNANVSAISFVYLVNGDQRGVWAQMYDLYSREVIGTKADMWVCPLLGTDVCICLAVVKTHGQLEDGC